MQVIIAVLFILITGFFWLSARLYLIAICKVLRWPKTDRRRLIAGSLLWILMSLIVLSAVGGPIKILKVYSSAAALWGICPLIIGALISYMTDKLRWIEFGKLVDENGKKH